MKLAQFRELCDREWDKPRRGDVVSLLLTEASRQELTTEVLADAPEMCSLWLTEAELAAVRRGELPAIPNPVTRTAVRIRTGKSAVRDSARVRLSGGTYRNTWWPSISP